MARSSKPAPADEPTAPEVLAEADYRRDPRRYMRKAVLFFDDGTELELNPNRPSLTMLFSRHHDGRDAPDGSEEVMWLLWHAAGRPGADEARSDDAAIAAWVGTIDDMEWVTVPRPGKAG